MNRPPRLHKLLSASLALAVVGISTHAQQADKASMEEIQSNFAEFVRHALGLDEPPSATPWARPARTTRVSDTSLAAAAHDMSPLERQVRQILGLLPTLPDAPTSVASASPGADQRSTQAPSQTSAPDPAATPGPVALPDARAPIAGADVAPAPPVAATPAAATATPAQGWLAGQAVVALDESQLDTMRGGFLGEGGLKISFGIERAIYINGNLVTTTSLNLSELGTLSAGKAAALALPEVGNRIALIQNGAGNTVLGDLAPGAIGTVIQNSLNGQKIQSLTTINATVNSLGVLKSIEMQRNLRSAITDSLRR